MNHREIAVEYLEACLFNTHEMTNAEKMQLAQIHATLAVADAGHTVSQSIDDTRVVLVNGDLWVGQS